MVIYRPEMRSDIEKSMARAKKFNTEEEMLNWIRETIEKDFSDMGVPRLMPIKPYVDMSKETVDERNGWQHTRLLKVSGYPGMGKNDVILGFTDLETFKDEIAE